MNISRPRTSSDARTGFTLVELLIAIAIVATLAAIVVLILNPVEYIKRGRDAQRLRDSTLINQALSTYAYGAAVQNDEAVYGPAGTCVGEPSQTLFVSVPDTEDPPAPPDGWQYGQVAPATLRNIDSTGWIPVDFASIATPLRPLTALPVDPVNTFNAGFYYTYTCGSYELTIRFETDRYTEIAATDGGDYDYVYQTGTRLNITPEQEPYKLSTSATSLPAKASNPSPSNGEGGVITSDLTVSWSGSGADYYTVRYGTTDPPPFFTTTTESTAHAGNLMGSTKYYWQVDSHNEAGVTEGDVWNFTTGPASGTAVLYPNATYSNLGWAISGAATEWEAVDDLKGSSNTTSTYIWSDLNDEVIDFELTDTAVPSGAIITEIRMIVTHSQSFADELEPRIRLCDVSCGEYVSSTPITPLTAWTYEDIVAVWDNSVLSLSSDNIVNLQAGLRSIKSGSGAIDVAQLYIEVDYTK